MKRTIAATWARLVPERRRSDVSVSAYCCAFGAGEAADEPDGT